MFWENSPQHKGAGQASLKRSMGVIHMAHDMKEEDWDHSEVDRYGLGTGTYELMIHACWYVYILPLVFVC